MGLNGFGQEARQTYSDVSVLLKTVVNVELIQFLVISICSPKLRSGAVTSRPASMHLIPINKCISTCTDNRLPTR